MRALLVRCCHLFPIAHPAFYLVAVAAALVIAASFSPVAAEDWMTGAEMPTARSEISAAALGDRIYVPGGLVRRGATRSLEAYDTKTDTWYELASMPVGVHHFGAAALGGKLYVSGGYVDLGFNPDVRSLWAYDPETDDWQRMAGMPLPRAAHQMVTLAGKLYVVGGVGPEPTRLMIYDPATNAWDSTAAPLPTPREHLAAVADDHRLYVIGGRWAQVGNLATVEVYDPAQDTWSRLPDMPTRRGGLTAALAEGRIYVFGGESLQSARTFDENEVLDPMTGRWKPAADLPTPRHGVASATFGCRIAVIGGARASGRRSFATLSQAIEVYEGACGKAI